MLFHPLKTRLHVCELQSISSSCQVPSYNLPDLCILDKSTLLPTVKFIIYLQVLVTVDIPSWNYLTTLTRLTRSLNFSPSRIGSKFPFFRPLNWVVLELHLPHHRSFTIHQRSRRFRVLASFLGIGYHIIRVRISCAQGDIEISLI